VKEIFDPLFWSQIIKLENPFICVFVFRVLAVLN